MMTSRLLYIYLILIIVALSSVVTNASSSIRGRSADDLNSKTDEHEQEHGQINTTSLHSAEKHTSESAATTSTDRTRTLKQKRQRDTTLSPTPSPTPRPTLKPTPKPTINPVYNGIQKPVGKDKNKDKPLKCFSWCNVRAKNKSWNKVCTWDKCNGCDTCLLDKDLMPGQEVLKCAGWCAGHTSPWSEVCTYKNCGGCDECTYENDDIEWRCPDKMSDQLRFFEEYPRGEDCSCCSYYEWQFGDGCCEPIKFKD